MFRMLGLGQLSNVEAWTLVLTAVAICLIIGYVLDLIANRMGFGIFGNAFICLLGIVVAMMVFRNYIGEMSMGRLPLMMGFASASITLHLFMLIFLRRALKL